jgi:hypothetical protein
MMSNREYSSFRDPSGVVFQRDGVLYRQINYAYLDQYRCLMDSGLYRELVEQRLLIPHKEVDAPCLDSSGALIIHPKKFPLSLIPTSGVLGNINRRLW